VAAEGFAIYQSQLFSIMISSYIILHLKITTQEFWVVVLR